MPLRALLSVVVCTMLLVAHGRELATKAPYPGVTGEGVAQVLREAAAAAEVSGAKLSVITRHGSRFATSGKGCRKAEAVLRQGTGEHREWACSEQDLSRADSISLRGEDEAQGIGRRFGAAAAVLLGRPAPGMTEVYSTDARRTQQTARHFLSGLDSGWEEGCCAALPVDVTPRHQDRAMRFFDLCEAYDAGWDAFKPHVETRLAPQLAGVAERVSARLGAVVSADEAEAVYKECLFQWHNALPDEREDEDELLCSLFSDEDFASLGAAKNLKDYHKKGPGAAAAFDGAALACTLLQRVLSELEGGADAPSLILRFAHAETLIPLYTLLGIGRGVAAEDYRLSQICPMASNIAFALLGTDVLLFHNEVQVAWNIPACDGRHGCPLDAIRAAFPPSACVWDDMCSV
eukprot:TRINITY_DN7045_c0_g1_i1.p1 TRINITY_DN7045_c0_g1~~TRINITY_DN7045_c0_g1_i1.p1  ORF type:complete len:405 (+),score=122.11 TRINITY_DN7045_c0_g1_i1:133-1347(+)